MSGQFAVKVMDGRLGSNGAKLFCSIAIGMTDDEGKFHGAIKIRDCVLRESNAGKDYVALPSKPRVKRGQNSLEWIQQVDAKKDNQPIWDTIVDLYFEKSSKVDEKGAPTTEAWAFKDAITEQAVALYTLLSNTANGRGTAPAGVQTRVTGNAPNIFGGSDDDNLLPF